MKTKHFQRISSILLSLAAVLCAFAGCTPSDGGSNAVSYIPTQKIEGSDLYVKKVENLPDDFIFGMDASCVPALEASGVKYYNFDGQEQDVFQTLAESGVNYIRVRIWNNPYDKNGNGYGGGNCDIDNAVEIGKRATKYGMKLLVNFHYSDFWADPGKQMVPAAWRTLSLEAKADALYQYTVDSLNKLKDAGVSVGMVQVGNETNGSFCGENKWPNITTLMKSGTKAVREIFPDALVTVHFANPEKSDSYASYANNMEYYGVDYDVFASSYYPYWHGTLENLTNVLTKVNQKHGKKVMVMETSYAYTTADSDFNGNTISDGGTIVKDYPFTVQGQATEVRDVIETVANIPGGIGVCYWEGTWITVGQNSWEENHEKWEKYGSGWASSYAASYDPGDAGKYYGGCAVDNQAMFDPNGKPLESLRIFNLARYGNEVTPLADALEDTIMICDIGKPITMPETVNAIMTDGSLQPVPVTWDISADKLTTMAATEGKYTVTGTADGRTATAYVSVVSYNYLKNDSFETGKLDPWVLNEIGNANELKLENKVTDSLTGTWHMHFWSAAANSVEFTLEQTVANLSAGKYKYSISIMGGDAGATDVYAYVKINGETVATAPMSITSYGNWDTGTISGIDYAEGDTLVVGIYVKCAGAGNGAWGKIDDAILNSEN